MINFFASLVCFIVARYLWLIGNEHNALLMCIPAASFMALFLDIPRTTVQIVSLVVLQIRLLMFVHGWGMLSREYEQIDDAAFRAEFLLRNFGKHGFEIARDRVMNLE
jgi:hypothetical protein